LRRRYRDLEKRSADLLEHSEYPIAYLHEGIHVYANKAYYETEDVILQNNEFDLLAENGLATRNFRKKVEHYAVMGSLSKCKDAETFSRWLKKRRPKMLLVLPKLDGASIALSARDSKIVRWASRGDGLSGNDISDNALHTQAEEVLAKHN